MAGTTVPSVTGITSRQQQGRSFTGGGSSRLGPVGPIENNCSQIPTTESLLHNCPVAALLFRGAILRHHLGRITERNYALSG